MEIGDSLRTSISQRYSSQVYKSHSWFEIAVKIFYNCIIFHLLSTSIASLPACGNRCDSTMATSSKGITTSSMEPPSGWYEAEDLIVLQTPAVSACPAHLDHIKLWNSSILDNLILGEHKKNHTWLILSRFNHNSYLSIVFTEKLSVLIIRPSYIWNK